jgi:hypothetical protein
MPVVGRTWLVRAAKASSSRYICDSCVISPWNVAKNGVSASGRFRQCAVPLQSSNALGGVVTWKSVNELLVT